MSFFGNNYGCQDDGYNGHGGGCGCDPCTLILLLLLCGNGGKGGCGCDACSIIWIMLILNCLCGHKNGPCGDC